jgi:DNA-directed RNA polymerase specialized sigma24 family protein
MRRTTEELLKDLGRSPTTDEIAAELKTTKADVERMRTESAFPISLDAPVRNDGDAKHGDFISDEGPDVTFDILRRGDFSRLAKALERLEPLEQQVLALRFGGDSMPFSEVAKELSLAEHIVRRIGRRVMAKLMHPSQALEDLRDETLGNEERADWQSDGVCREIGIEAFFSDTAKKHINGSLKSTKRICQDCPVRDVCLKFALDNNINEGIWGGASPPDRGRLLASV